MQRAHHWVGARVDAVPRVSSALPLGARLDRHLLRTAPPAEPVRLHGQTPPSSKADVGQSQRSVGQCIVWCLHKRASLGRHPLCTAALQFP